MKAIYLSPLLLATLLSASPAVPADTTLAANTASGKSRPLEKVISIARNAHPDMRIINTYKDQLNNREVDKIFYYLPEKKEAWIMTINPANGMILSDHPYKLPEKRESIPLEQLLATLRKNFNIEKIIRVRTEQKNGVDVRIIIYLDQLKQQRIMLVNAKTGEVLSDKARKYG